MDLDRYKLAAQQLHAWLLSTSSICNDIDIDFRDRVKNSVRRDRPKLAVESSSAQGPVENLTWQALHSLKSQTDASLTHHTYWIHKACVRESDLSDICTRVSRVSRPRGPH
jgi:hypothetical protein